MKNLFDEYIDFRDSDVLEGCNEGNILAFLYYLKKGNLHDKSFNPYCHANTEKDPLAEREKELRLMYKNTDNQPSEIDLDFVKNYCRLRFTPEMKSYEMLIHSFVETYNTQVKESNNLFK